MHYNIYFMAYVWIFIWISLPAQTSMVGEVLCLYVFSVSVLTGRSDSQYPYILYNIIFFI